ncbi:MAG: hypothetical protein N2Z23_04460 [Pyrinomonadaceae bacterium]|nr:hypothetical protein [Pyrinomonadaceae bacterium]MCX7639676.1 hypothetical protein [Pyrinomonadaceae bacterium]MDW8304578.1 hypothetical protein [Acidobacteriota bacterium]
MSVLKKVILWEYERGTWQYDLLCALIIAFIFLTPKSWFEKEFKTTTARGRVVIKQEDFLQSKEQIENQVRQIVGDPRVEVVAWRERRNEKGEVFYEVDLR